MIIVSGAPSNKSLDASGGCAFGIIIGAAKVEWKRAAASTQPLCFFHLHIE